MLSVKHPGQTWLSILVCARMAEIQRQTQRYWKTWKTGPLSNLARNQPPVSPMAPLAQFKTKL